MPLSLTWEHITLRIGLACVASFFIGLNRDEGGHSAGIRTTMLVCLAATLAMLQVNLLLPLAGKASSSFVVMDLMRLPLGILSGIGFIGAGAIIKRDEIVNGVTTAATIWVVTVLGLLFGGGNLYLGVAGSVLTCAILWVLKKLELQLPRARQGSLHLTFSPGGPGEKDVQQLLSASNLTIVHWKPVYQPTTELVALDCELKWSARSTQFPEIPAPLEDLRSLPGVVSLRWEE